MRGDAVQVVEPHTRLAQKLVSILMKRISYQDRRFVISIAGESGSGKSETAVALDTALSAHGVSSIVLQQDDYFVFPPKSNDKRRRAKVSWVGPQEVKMDLLSSHLRAFKSFEKFVDKPLVNYQLDEIMDERYEFGDTQVLLIEGTYTSLLPEVDIRVFISSTFKETLNHRQKRNRDPSELDEFSERVLKIEHEVIKTHLNLADILVDPNYDVKLVPGQNC